MEMGKNRQIEIKSNSKSDRNSLYLDTPVISDHDT